jgi:hypothetical protein
MPVSSPNPPMGLNELRPQFVQGLGELKHLVRVLPGHPIGVERVEVARQVEQCGGLGAPPAPGGGAPVDVESKQRGAGSAQRGLDSAAPRPQRRWSKQGRGLGSAHQSGWRALGQHHRVGGRLKYQRRRGESANQHRADQSGNANRNYQAVADSPPWDHGCASCAKGQPVASGEDLGRDCLTEFGPPGGQARVGKCGCTAYLDGTRPLSMDVGRAVKGAELSRWPIVLVCPLKGLIDQRV